jgi:hypothetical protein
MDVLTTGFETMIQTRRPRGHLSDCLAVLLLLMGKMDKTISLVRSAAAAQYPYRVGIAAQGDLAIADFEYDLARGRSGLTVIVCTDGFR